MSIRASKSISQLRRALHSSATAPNPSHLLASHQSSVRSHFNSMTVQKLKLECRERGLKQNGRKFELVDRIVGYEKAKSFSSKSAAKEFSSSASASKVAKVDGFTVPKPPVSKEVADAPAITKIPLNETVSASSKHAIDPLEAHDQIDVADGSTSRVSSMNSDSGDGFTLSQYSEPLSSRDKNFLTGLGLAIVAWFYFGNKADKKKTA